MKNHRTGWIRVVVSLIFLAVITVPQIASTADVPKFITMTTYPIGSLGSLLSTGFCSAIDKKAGIRARPTRPTPIWAGSCRSKRAKARRCC